MDLTWCGEGERTQPVKLTWSGAGETEASTCLHLLLPWTTSRMSQVQRPSPSHPPPPPSPRHGPLGVEQKVHFLLHYVRNQFGIRRRLHSDPRTRRAECRSLGAVGQLQGDDSSFERQFVDNFSVAECVKTLDDFTNSKSWRAVSQSLGTWEGLCD